MIVLKERLSSEYMHPPGSWMLCASSSMFESTSEVPRHWSLDVDGYTYFSIIMCHGSSKSERMTLVGLSLELSSRLWKRVIISLSFSHLHWAKDEDLLYRLRLSICWPEWQDPDRGKEEEPIKDMSNWILCGFSEIWHTTTGDMVSGNYYLGKRL